MINMSLNSPMTLNLLNLQSISKEQASVQQKLATGLKVFSPLHNPNAYYTAVSLRSQVQELNSFMDSLGQSVQALKNLDNTLNTGINFLEQAMATARVALNDLIKNNETSPPAPVPTPDPSPSPPPIGSIELTRDDLEIIMKDNGINGKVVTNQAEFAEAINNAKAGDTIAIMGKLDFYNFSFNLNNITLSGAEGIIREHNLEDQFYVNEADKAIFNFKIDGNNHNSAFITENNVVVSDISLNYEVEASTTQINYQAFSNTGNLTINNTNIVTKSKNHQNIFNDLINNQGNGVVNLKGKINIEVDDNRVRIFHSSYFGKYIQDADSTLNVKYVGDLGTIFDGGNVELYGTVTAHMEGNSTGFMAAGGNNIIGGSVHIDSTTKTANFNIASKSNLTLLSGADLHIHANKGMNLLESGKNLKWEKGATVSYNDAISWKSTNNGSGTTSTNVTQAQDSDLSAIFGWTKSAALTSQKVPLEKAKTNENNGLLDYLQKETDALISQQKQISMEAAAERYNGILSYYNNLIGTNNYLGKNLLEDNSLMIKFSSRNYNKLEINGRDIRYEKMGINQASWTSIEDIEKSISEIQNALGELRQQGREFSNYTSIISSRDNFMGTLSNILTEGADKLTLADINEESANMLALSSRRMLATNSLSLAAKSSRSIFKLF